MKMPLFHQLQYWYIFIIPHCLTKGGAFYDECCDICLRTIIHSETSSLISTLFIFPDEKYANTKKHTHIITTGAAAANTVIVDSKQDMPMFLSSRLRSLSENSPERTAPNAPPITEIMRNLSAKQLRSLNDVNPRALYIPESRRSRRKALEQTICTATSANTADTE